MDRADRSAPTVRKASCIACRMASNRANVNDIQLGRDIGEAQVLEARTQASMRTPAMVVRDPFAQDPSEMSLVEGDQPVQTLPPYRADQALAKGVGLWRPHGDLQHMPAHRRDRPVDCGREDAIPIVEDEPVGCLRGDDGAKLLDRPRRCYAGAGCTDPLCAATRPVPI